MGRNGPVRCLRNHDQFLGAAGRPARALPAAVHRATVRVMNAPDPGAEPGRSADAAERDPPGRARLRWLAEEQAALRRVATLVGGGARPAEVFRAVADELGHLIGAEATFVSRVDHTPGQRGDLEAHSTVVGSDGGLTEPG